MKTTYQKAEADVAHLKPKHDATEFGLLCGAGAGIVLGIFAALAGLDLNRFGLPGAAVIGIAFTGPWLYYRSQWKAYYSALFQREAELRK